MKYLWLAIFNIEGKIVMQRVKDGKAYTRSHLLEGAATAGWPQAMGAEATGVHELLITQDAVVAP